MGKNDIKIDNWNSNRTDQLRRSGRFQWRTDWRGLLMDKAFSPKLEIALAAIS